MKFKLIYFSVFLLALDFLLLVLLGKTYTKFLVFPPYFYAHDTILILATLTPLIRYNKHENRIKSVEILFLLALVYLGISLFNIEFEIRNKGYYMFRQFAVFGYPILIYIILKQLYSIKKAAYYFIRSINLFGFLCLLVQVLYILYYCFSEGEHPFFERNYYSPMIIMGLLVFGSYILIKVKNPYLKFLFFVFNFFIALSTGHDSVYLSLLVISFSYLFLKSKKRIRIFIVMVFLLIGLLVMIYIPSFSDVNMQWRIIYWKDCLLRLSNNYLIFGEGFGVPYLSSQTVINLNNLMLSYSHNVQIIGDENYLIAPHNSFLSMFIHIGVLPVLFFLYPIIRVLLWFDFVKNKESLFLILCLIGMLVFSFFNVILELPHSSSIFWVVYFVLIFKLNKESEGSILSRKF
tara:strand:+ start:24803 stop:26017 length:1215 start_codon:yes stop_codon:yes gene_type:complete